MLTRWLSAAIALTITALNTPLVAQDKYAVLVGVATYDTDTFANLKYAAKDAEALGSQLTALGFKTTVMTSESTSARLRPTTPKKIADTISAVTRSCANDDTLLIALSGHGVQFSDEELLPEGVRETYFCPTDASLSDKSTLVKVSSIIKFMNASAASRKLLLVDACQENVLSTEGQRKSAKRIELESVHENRRSVPGGMAVLFSCMSGQFSWEHDPISHSVFSHHVIQYLKGNSDQRFYDSGNLDLTGLVSYVSKQTNDYVIGNNLSADGQFPVLRGSSANWSLGRLDLQPIAKTFTNSIGIKLNLIPAGTFMMGSPASEADRDDEETQHRVTLTKDFYLGTTEVTQGQWESVMGTTPWKGQNYVQEGSNNAATYVSPNDAVEFCRKLSVREGKTYRLPTEAEWEYACRGGTTAAYSFGADAAQLSDYGWWGGIVGNGNSQAEQYAHAVGLKRANAFGLHDMHGNVWEWCSDWKGDYPTGNVTDPQGPSEGSRRVCRGGSWSNVAGGCRSAYRGSGSPDYRYGGLGFRVAVGR